MNWIRERWPGVVEHLIALLVASLLGIGVERLGLISLIPKLGPKLLTTVPLPIWSLLCIAVVFLLLLFRSVVLFRREKGISGVTPGAKVRVLEFEALGDAEKNMPPTWLEEMGRHCGKEYRVALIGRNGLVRLEGVEFDFHRDWLISIPEKPAARRAFHSG